MTKKVKHYDIYADLQYLEARNPDGTDNALNDVGAADDAYRRVTENAYVDGGSLPVQKILENDPAGPGVLPSPRDVSNAVMAAGTTNTPSSFGVNELFDFFGQALTHDVAEASTGNSGDPPIFTLGGLPFPFTRTPFETGSGTDHSNPREQINEETSFLDLSFIYGNDQARLDLARADLPGHSGQSAKLLLGAGDLLPTIKEVGLDAGLTSLQVLSIYRPAGFGGLPDPTTNPPDSTFENLYYAGDNRANQQPPLITLQTIWAREHNYQVDKLTPTAEKYCWTQDQLFDAARAITEAEWQHVIYDEYVPKLLGKCALEAYHGYNKNVDPSIINEWTTVAFRLGHDQSSNSFGLLNEDGSKVQINDPNFPSDPFAITLGTAFALAAAANDVTGAGHNSADLDTWIRGLTSQFSQEIDGKVVDGNRNVLFGIGVTADLEVFDIERGRDHGVWNYNQLREGLGLSTYSDFDSFGAANHLDAARLAALKTVYGNDINKLDSIVGGLLEAKVYDSQLGETFTILNVLQFEALRDGDKFYYENRFKDNPDLIALIDHTSLADIIQRNTGIDHVYHDAFAAHNRISADHGKLDGTATADLAIGSNWGDKILTYGGDDDVYGGKGNDKVHAGYGSDLINGEYGNDSLWGDSGRDTFVFSAHSGKDCIKDFNWKYDKIDLSDYGFDSWKEVKQVAHNTSKGVVIQLDHHDSVEIVGCKLSKLSDKNFIFDGLDHYTV
jgi:Ca2+-binding RTX toxin-like protein